MATTAPVTDPAASVPSGAVAAAGVAPAPVPVIQAYDPENTQPYQPAQLPDVDQASQPIAAALPKEQPIQDLGAATHTGAIAYVGDQILRGFMQGRALSQMNNAVRLHRTSQGLQANLKAAGDDYYAYVKQTGAGPKHPTPEYNQLLDRVNAAHKAVMDFYGQHIEGVKIDKKTGQMVPAKKSILDRLKGNDPAEIPAAIYEALAKTGPSVLYQARQFQTPQYWQYVTGQGELAQTQQGLGIATAQAAEQKAHLEQTVYSLSALAHRTPEQEAQLQFSLQALHSMGSAASRDRKISTYIGKDGHQYDVLQDALGHNYEVRSDQEVRPGGASAKPIKGATFYKGHWVAALFDPLTNQLMPGSINPNEAVPSYLTAGVSERSNVLFQHMQNGDIVPVTTLNFTHKFAPAPAGSGASEPEPAQSPHAQSPMQTRPPTSQHSTASASGAGSGNANVLVGQPIGKGVTPDITNAQTVANGADRTYRAAQKLLANLTPPASNSLSLLYVAATNQLGKSAARMNNAEINRSYDQAIGSIPARIRASVWKSSEGTLPPDVAKAMVNVIGIAKEAADEDLRNLTSSSSQPNTAAPPSADANMPPPAVVNAMQNGQYVHGSNGATYQKVNGKLQLVTQ